MSGFDSDFDFDIETHDFDLEEPTDSAQVVEIEQRGAKNIDKTEPADSYHRFNSIISN
jgi:hypothetical protein